MKKMSNFKKRKKKLKKVKKVLDKGEEMWYYSQALDKRESEKAQRKGEKSTLKIKQRIGTQEIYLRIDFERN